jgi:uncharacterized integral membrane protein
MSDPLVEPNRGQAPRGRRRDSRVVVMGVAAVLLVWFALANLQTVKVNFWVFSAHARLITVIVISGILGAAIALLSRRWRRRQARDRDR